MEFLLLIGLIAGIVFAVYWGIWLLWCWVVPQIWVTGPENLTRPDFWLFAGAFLLVSIVGKAVLGRSSRD